MSTRIFGGNFVFSISALSLTVASWNVLVSLVLLVYLAGICLLRMPFFAQNLLIAKLDVQTALEVEAHWTVYLFKTQRDADALH